MSGLTLDAGGLIALEKNDRRVIALLARVRERRERVTIPATVLAQVIRRPSREAKISRLVRHPATDLVALDGREATAVGVLLAATRTRDIVDAHVVLCARARDQLIVTSDPDDLEALDPNARLIVV